MFNRFLIDKEFGYGTNYGQVNYLINIQNLMPGVSPLNIHKLRPEFLSAL